VFHNTRELFSEPVRDGAISDDSSRVFLIAVYSGSILACHS